jgi:hypothetical protein
MSVVCLYDQEGCPVGSCHGVALPLYLLKSAAITMTLELNFGVAKKTKPGQTNFPASSLPKIKFLFVFFQYVFNIIRGNPAVGFFSDKHDRSQAAGPNATEA